jgi:ribosome-associated translation inhibitor RaiA
MRDKAFKQACTPVKKINSFDVEIPEDITDEIDKTLAEIESYFDQKNDKSIFSERKRKLISRISGWKISGLR